MTITDFEKKQLFKLVRVEAKKLRAEITEEESKRLDFNSLIPDRTDRCVYGQLTGDCESKRAFQLIHLCAKKVYRTHANPLKVIEKDSSIPPCHRLSFYASPIEELIVRYPKNNERLIKYLKKETDKLILK